MILEPYVLPGTATCNNEEHPTRWDFFRSEVELRAQAAKRVAAVCKRNGITVVPELDFPGHQCEPDFENGGRVSRGIIVAI